MTQRRVGTCIGALALGILGTAILAGSPPAPREDGPTWGKAHEGLRIGIDKVHFPRPGRGRPEFRVILENVGDDDLAVNIGIMLANGRAQYPNAIWLLAEGPDGRKQQLIPNGPGRIAGRVDPMLVPLPAGASYAVRCTLNQFSIGESAEPAAHLKPGVYRISAVYDSAKARTFERKNVMSFFSARHWKGTVRSAPRSFDLGGGE